MIDPVSLAVGGVLLLAGFLLGKAHRRTPRVSTGCPGCDHDLSFRDPEGGCTKTVEKARLWNRYGDPIGFEWVRCECRNHTTPDQILLDASWKPQQIGDLPRDGQ